MFLNYIKNIGFCLIVTKEDSPELGNGERGPNLVEVTCASQHSRTDLLKGWIVSGIPSVLDKGSGP